GVTVERLLDLAGGHVLAAAHDDVLDAAREPVVAGGVAEAHVAGPEPAAGREDGAVGLGAVPVAGRHHRAAHPELARLAGDDVPPGGVDDPDLDRVDRPPEEAAPAKLRGPRDREPDRLRHAPADLDRQTRQVEERS